MSTHQETSAESTANDLDLSDILGSPSAAGQSEAAEQPAQSSAGQDESADASTDDPTQEFIDPLTGEVIDLTDADALIDCFERIKAQDSAIYVAKQIVQRAIANLSEGTAKTRRVRGHRRRAKVEMPDAGWDQSKLKEAYNAYPQFRDELLSISSLRVKLREFKKVVNEKGPEDFQCFKGIVQAAELPPSGTPRVTVEQ